MTDVISVTRSISLNDRDATVARERARRAEEEEKLAKAEWERQRQERAEVAGLARDALRRVFGRGVHFSIGDGEITWEGDIPTAEQVEQALDDAGFARVQDEAHP